MWKAVLVGAVLAVSMVVVAHAMDVNDVIEMLRAGIGEDVILKAVDSSGETLILTTDDLVDLKDAGATDWFLDELLNREERAPSYGTRSYGSYYLGPSYYSIGLVYDPFDYYFACYPYYYAYVAPLSFSWAWWYYGGPYHHAWCEPYYGSRVWYYSSHWGTRSIWNRGFTDVRYHVPSYAPIGKEGDRLAFNRAEMDRPSGRTGGIWQRSTPGQKPVGSGVLRRSGREVHRYSQAPIRREPRSSTWGRQTHRGPVSAPPPRNPRSEVRQYSPRPSTARPSTPSAPPRRAWSR